MREKALQQLAGKEYDLVIVGCGAYGAFAAEDAALRGLSVAVIDKGDFCGATSANSLKIIHGGVRYLQNADIIRTRESTMERYNFFRMAPHLVHPISCIMPTRTRFMRSKPAMKIGMILNDILSCDRNQNMDSDKRIPCGRIVSKQKFDEIVPGLTSDDITGGAIWHDAYAWNTERLIIGAVRSAVGAGADAANYVEMTSLIRKEKKVSGVNVRDVMTGEEFSIKARMVINNTGPFTIIKPPADDITKPEGGISLAINVIIKKQLIKDYGAGLSYKVSDENKERLFFFVPWHDVTLAGTYYRAQKTSKAFPTITDEDIDALINDLNAAYPPAQITRDDITMLHAGMLPTQQITTAGKRDPDLMMHYQLLDHQAIDNIEGIITVLGVKYTTARNVAEKTINLACKKLDISPRLPRSAQTPLPGGNIDDFEKFMKEGLEQGISRQMLYNFGSEYTKVLELGNENPELLKPLSNSTPVTGAEAVYSVREELAETLSDIVFRRTDLGALGIPDNEALVNCASFVAKRKRLVC
ncbi:hypothetical protein BVX94_02660 [bacterium B17]|nr:hypothetical protein BVX94_02660 [bacterium B17]